MRPVIALSPILIMTSIQIGAVAQTQPNPPGQRRFTFGQFSTRHDANQDGKVEQAEFKGVPQFFRWLDEDGDGVVTDREFEKRTRQDGGQQPWGGKGSPGGVKVVRDLEYARVDGESLRLDLYLPWKSETVSERPKPARRRRVKTGHA